MKKLIKLLFPKAYQAIYDEGYNQAYYEYNKDYNQVYYDDYHDDYYDYQQYEQHELEMQRLHDEHYAEEANAWEEYRMEEEQELAELYLPKKPVLEVGDKIHLHSKQGMYTVTKVYEYSFAYRTRDSIDDAYADYSDYKCHAGGRWNSKGN